MIQLSYILSHNKDMYDIKSDPQLQYLFNNLYYKSYIFTNGTLGHAYEILDKMKLYSFKKISQEI